MSFRAKQAGHFATQDGTRLYYEIHGSGVPIVWIYGIACVMNHYHHQIAEFSADHRCVLFDLRGHHQSEVPKDLKTMTVATMAEDVIDLMDHLELKKAHLVGHSFGVPVLLEFSQRAPERIESLTFINGFAKNPVKGMFGLDLAEYIFLAAKLAQIAAPEILEPIWKTLVRNPVSMALAGALGGFNLKHTEWKDIEIYSKGLSELALSSFIPLFEDMMDFQGEAAAAAIKAPTLVIAGDHDLVTPLSFQRALQEMIPKSRFVLVKGGSHCTQLDFPKIVNTKIRAHIQRVEAKRS